ncbi:LEAF RUST 10 DISEASE-RESISTANCE LOCUS RECEPTOR-LIKE PROTEIN KINASE-like 1.1 isoform X2 [Actinidia eriantha]|uniref:LEAF RUST 10 DISEASE-RESISTANCE LOCUS RECEPTOR-LIKE PROTEIN KINASE-like 1.1 isoform X2 n=1 Tax=Actinidia eriantha TaxID=165200 RepID=UPI0025879F40|nr:LEAF RUST 10 DISEASE-RESISTANCE LOCUS RECEPTOR-LIKE PROTEIN KINASE-like 1.1 isoform X2 [Actinidia eriantha]
MAVPSILLFFVYSHLLLLHSAGCPESFDCGTHGQIQFPYTNSTYTECGLVTVDCSKPFPEVILGEKSYEVTSPLEEDSLKIKDRELERLIRSDPCELFSHNRSIAFSPSISFTIGPVPSLTLFKCNEHQTDDYFKGHQSYSKCPGYTLYYKYPSVSVSTLGDYPSNCVVIYLPIVLPPGNPGHIDLFSLLTAEFTIRLHVTKECLDCHSNGGICPKQSGKFHCLNKKEGGISTSALILATVIPGVIVLACLFLIIWKCNKWNHISSYIFRRKISSDPSLKEDIEGGSVYFGVPVFTYSELKEATQNFDPSKELGDGGFGTVYYGKLRDGREVAVKRLYEHNCKRVTQFMNEIEILTCLRHRSLVTLYGCTSRHSRELLLVYEYIPNGTVADHLHGNRAKDGSLPWPIRMNIAIETATALSYLHASEIIHRDVKTSNILLDNNFCVKVADFGLSRLFPTDVTHVSTAPQGTPGYVDPDYHQCYQLTVKSDVYSFGVVLIELISSLPAVDINRHRHEINLANLAINRIQNGAFNELIDLSLGYESDSTVERMTTSVAEVAFRCLQREKEMRPTMDEVLETLKDIQGYKDENSGTMPPFSPDDDEAMLLKNKKVPPSPVSVTSRWPSGSTISNSSG